MAKPLLKSSRKWAAIWVITPKRRITSFKVCRYFKWHTFVSDKWMQKPLNNLRSWYNKQFWLIPNSPNHDLQGKEILKTYWQFLFLILCPVKWLSICQICLCPSNSNVTFYEDSDGGSGEKSFWFLRVFIFNHVRTMLNPKALMVDGSV